MVEYHNALDMLRDIDAPVKLVIAGNHDRSLDRDWVLGHLKYENLRADQGNAKWKQARDLWTAPDGRAKTEGVTLLDEGVHQVHLHNGAYINLYASPYTPEFCDWGFPYERGEDRFNTPLTSLPDAKNITNCPIPGFSTGEPIDILVTHGPPYGRLDAVDREVFVGCPHLLRALMRSRPRIHCFGHIHEGWGAELVHWSSDADHANNAPTTTAAWEADGWKAGVADDGGIEAVQTDLHAAKERHVAFLDLSSDGLALVRGQSTAVINAAIMNVAYEPVNAPWLVDIDLRLQQGPSD
ncbi:hypothetical protein LTR85_007676 [Meristemomyces frigidus]|nr:hypothetical protein LTR85_007676 [Meristemomyces frigidus]